jgi:sensor histidine kinase YesM
MGKGRRFLSRLWTGNAGYFWLTLAIFIPLLITVHAYIHSLDTRDDEFVAFLITVFILVGIYAGRYLSLLWTGRGAIIPNKRLMGLAITVIVSAILAALAAQFILAIRAPFLGFILIGLPLLAFSISLGMLIKMVRTNIKNRLQDARASAEQSQSELKLLQSQLSPHFLFNTLNNIYGISLSQHEKVPTLLLKLSSLLRYSVYDAKELYVPLKNELEYISNYIEFEKIRNGDKLVLGTSIEIDYNPDAKIAPLLLIVFIENAFKHAKNTTEHKIYIDIVIKTWGNFILFSVRNSNDGVKHESAILNKDSGFGLDNVAKRLDLLYWKEYDLKIEDQLGFYTVMLQVKAK